jgi:prophage DNA circulation protein
LSGGASTRTNPSFLDTATSTTNAVEYLNNASTSVNTYQNSKTKINSGVEGISAAISSVQQGVSGLQGITFPVPTSTAGITKATSINLGI